MGQRAAIEEKELTLTASDGVKLPAFVALPAGVTGSPRVVIAPEIFGVSPWIKDVARSIAREGFEAIAPEIFVRDPLPAGTDRASWIARLQRLDVPQSIRDLRLALAALGDGKGASIGFCLGGALSILTAAGGGLSACVSCYGRPRWMSPTPAPHAIEAASRVPCPVLGIYGKNDPGIPLADAEELGKAFPSGSELALFDAGHAFLNDTRPDMYVEAAAQLAWPKIFGFLRRNLL